MRYIPACMILLFAYGCSHPINFDYIKSTVWLHESGFKIGDGGAVLFSKKQSTFLLHGDTIYYLGAPKAIIKSVDQKMSTLIVTSINRDQEGEYFDANMSLKENK